LKIALEGSLLSSASTKLSRKRLKGGNYRERGGEDNLKDKGHGKKKPKRRRRRPGEEEVI